MGVNGMMHDNGFLRVKEAAALLGVSPNTVRSWGEDGKIPEYRHPVNNYRLYKRAELERLLKKVERSASGKR
jgi:DNA (cytosine-5)-methyltransferase 1